MSCILKKMLVIINIVGTLLGDPMKSKDTVKARLDLEDLNIRKDYG